MGTPLFKLSDPIGDCSNDNKTPTFYQYIEAAPRDSTFGLPYVRIGHDH